VTTPAIETILTEDGYENLTRFPYDLAP